MCTFSGYPDPVEINLCGVQHIHMLNRGSSAVYADLLRSKFYMYLSQTDVSFLLLNPDTNSTCQLPSPARQPHALAPDSNLELEAALFQYSSRMGRTLACREPPTEQKTH